MKNKKRIAFLCVAINIILLLQLCLGTVMALEEEVAYVEPEQTVEEAVIEVQDGEMQIMAAAACAPSVLHSSVFNWAGTAGGYEASGSVTITYWSDGSTSSLYSATNNWGESYQRQTTSGGYDSGWNRT